MSRTEHLEWAKKRALKYVELGKLDEGFASFTSDLQKHEELEDAVEIQARLGGSQFVCGLLDTPEAMTRWIEGFN